MIKKFEGDQVTNLLSFLSSKIEWFINFESFIKARILLSGRATANFTLPIMKAEISLLFEIESYFPRATKFRSMAIAAAVIEQGKSISVCRLLINQ